LSAAIPVSNWEPDIQARLKARLADEVRYETELNLAVEMQQWFDTHRGVPSNLPVYSQNFDDALKQLGHDVNGSRRPPSDVLKATLAAMRDLVPNDLADTLERGGSSGSREEQKVSGNVSELLSLEGAMKDRNVVLKQRAEQAREAAVNFIAQVVEVSVPLKPFLSAIVNEVINASAEVLSKRILERVPIEEAIKKTEQVSSDVRTKIANAIDLLAAKLFGVAGVEGAAARAVKVEEVRARIAEEARRLTAAREAEAARARARPRGR
jgi:hypothetical protein